MNSIRDADLVAAAKSGDQQAFGTLVSTHRTMVWSVCLRITGNAYDAEDALQEALVAAWRSLPRFRGDSAFSTWLYRIASNAALAVVRRSRPESEVTDDMAVERDFAEKLAASDVVHRALRTVPPDFREALVLRELCDFTYAQIAEHQGVGVPTVKTRISRGRKALLEAVSHDGAL